MIKGSGQAFASESEKAGLAEIHEAFRLSDKNKGGETLPSVSFDEIRVRVGGGEACGGSVPGNKEFSTVTFKNLAAHFYFTSNAIRVKAFADGCCLEGTSPKKEKEATWLPEERPLEAAF